MESESELELKVPEASHHCSKQEGYHSGERNQNIRKHWENVIILVFWRKAKTKYVVNKIKPTQRKSGFVLLLGQNYKLQQVEVIFSKSKLRKSCLFCYIRLDKISYQRQDLCYKSLKVKKITKLPMIHPIQALSFFLPDWLPAPTGKFWLSSYPAAVAHSYMETIRTQATIIIRVHVYPSKL